MAPPLSSRRQATREKLASKSCRRFALVHRFAIDVDGGESPTAIAPGVDASQMTDVEDLAGPISGMAHDRFLATDVRTRYELRQRSPT
jgi:hypothetical protein